MAERLEIEQRKNGFLRAIAQDNLNHAYIFAGPNGTGKVGMAKWLAQTILCQRNKKGEKPCLQCNNCKRIADNDHPDVIRLSTDKASISVDDIREIIKDMSRTAYEGFNKIFVIEEADKMTTSAQNSLLKFLEEPSPGTTIILSTNAPNKLLTTIQSRCQQVDFLPENEDTRYQQLVSAGIPNDRAVILKSLTQDVEQAKDIYADEEIRDLLTMMSTYYNDLRQKKDSTFVYIQSHLVPLMSDRQRQQLGLDILLAHYREDLHQAYHSESTQLKGVQIAKETRYILKGIKQFQSYVPIQSVMENITLSVLAS